MPTASSSEFYTFNSAALSDVGAVRAINEDSFVVRDDIGLWAVADGVGGRDAGDHASRLVVEALSAVAEPIGGKSYLESVEAAIQQANLQMLDYAESTLGVELIGSTLACLVAYRDHAACLWAGDSRIYRQRDGKMMQLSKDHSIIQELIDAGELSPEKARSHPQRNVITRALGAGPELDIAVRRDALSNGDRYLICSDGLYSVLSDEELCALLGEPNVTAAANAAMAAALEREARDNVTLVVVDAQVAEPLPLP